MNMYMNTAELGALRISLILVLPNMQCQQMPLY